MSWDKNQHMTKEQFRYHSQYHARQSLLGKHVPRIGGKLFPPIWWKNGEIRVFWETGIPMSDIRVITDAINERANEIDLAPFEFKLFGSHASAMEQIDESLVYGQIDHEKLFALAASESWRDEQNGGKQHGDIYITTKSFVGDTVSWGAADFPFGAMVFTLHGNRSSNLTFLCKVALHETNHFLGMRGHCNDYLNVDEFRYDPYCNGHYSCPSDRLCEKCKFFLEHWWAQIEYEWNRLVK